MTMKPFRILALAVVLLLVPVIPGLAQTTTVRTSIAVAITDTSGNTFTVRSATGITASTAGDQRFVYVDGEQMQVRTVSGTTLTVIRGVNGRASTHVLDTPLYYGGAANYDSSTGNTGNPGGSGVFLANIPVGRCTRASNTNLPVIHPQSGTFYDCILQPSAATGITTQRTTHVWTALNLIPATFNRPYKKLRPEEDTYTALVTDEIIGYNTNVAGTISLPSATGLIGKVYRIQGEITGSATITIQALSSVGQTINGASSMNIQGNATSTNFEGIMIYSDGTNWFASVQNQ